MTLVEVMIAIVLLAFVILGVTAITDDSQNAKDRTVQTDRDNLQIETAMARLDWDFTQIWSPLYFTQRYQGSLDPQSNPAVVEMVYLYENHPRFRMPSKEGLPIPIIRSREKTEFIFLTMGNRRKLENQKQSNFMWVRYYLGDSPKSEDDAPAGVDAVEKKANKALMRQVFPEDVWSKEELNFEDTRSSVLLDQVESLEFQFWNMNTKKWETNIKTVIDGEFVQRGIKILITWFDSRGSKRTTERWLRPNWPMYVPKDQAAGGNTQGGIQSGNQGGSTGGNTANSGGGVDGDGDGVDDT